MAIAQRQDARYLLRLDPCTDQDWALACMQESAHIGRLLDPRNCPRLPEAAGERHGDEIHAGAGMARLHAGLAVMAVVEDDDGKIFRLLDPNRGEAAEAHQQVAIARYGAHAPVRTGQGEAE